MWSPDSLGGDVFIVDVDRDNWDCNSIKGISRHRQWIVTREKSQILLDTSSVVPRSFFMNLQTPMITSALPENSVVENSKIQIDTSTVWQSGFLDGSNLASYQVEISVISHPGTSSALVNTRFASVVLEAEYPGVNFRLRRDPCACPNCRISEFEKAVQSHSPSRLSFISSYGL